MFQYHCYILYKIPHIQQNTKIYGFLILLRQSLLYTPCQIFYTFSPLSLYTASCPCLFKCEIINLKSYESKSMLKLNIYEHDAPSLWYMYLTSIHWHHKKLTSNTIPQTYNTQDFSALKESTFLCAFLANIQFYNTTPSCSVTLSIPHFSFSTARY
jgi:hypothetical protein